MYRPLEHDYIGLSKFSSMENSDKHRLPLSSIVSTLSTQGEINSGLNLKETELRLGIPGSEREPGNGVSLFGKNLERNCSSRYSTGSLKASASGAKRVFSDAIDGCGKWVLSINGVSEVNLVENKNTQETPSLKEALASSSKLVKEKQPQVAEAVENGSVPAANLQGTENQSFCSRAQMVGWPPIRSFRKNTMVSTSTKHEEGTEDKSGLGCLYVKVSMDGAPYLRKVDLKAYSNYIDLSSALDDMFSCFTIGQYSSHGFSSCDGRCESFFSDLLHNSDHVLTYEDKDGDWMLVGDVPWKMFIVTCKRLRIVKGSEAIGLAPGAPEKSGTVDSFREFNGVRRAVLQEPLK